MIRGTFERELQALQQRILALGNEVSDNVVTAIELLKNRDLNAAQALIAADQEINDKRIALMRDSLILIATQQPMAGDLRLIASIIEITGELERINDYSKGIAKNSLLIGSSALPDVLGDMPEMATKTRLMLQRALEAVSQRDADLAKAIPADDDEIDALFNRTYREMLAYVAANPDDYQVINYLEWALHNLERAADRVTNICEWVVYMVTGQYIEMDSEFEAPPIQG